MITENDFMNTIEMDEYYVIWPSNSYYYFKDDYTKHHKGKEVKFGFKYNSRLNTQWLSVKELRKLIKKNIDPTFSG